jgi:predicted Zn finger-like uncharacterized protein
MDIICENCQSKFRIPDEKVPAGKAVSFDCPKCKNKITVVGAQKSSGVDEDQGADYAETETYDASEKPFDFVEEEGKTALVCESNSEIKKTLNDSLNSMEYHLTDAENVRDALTKMRYHNYDLVLVNENFDSSNSDENAVLIYLERLPMSIRRNMFVTLITDRFRTLDNMMAFNKSVNIIINTKNILDAEKILKRAITENDMFFRVFNESTKETGRA